MNKVKLFTDWVFAVWTVWVLTISTVWAADSVINTHISDPNGFKDQAVIAILYTLLSAPFYATVYFTTKWTVTWFQSKILTKYVVEEVEVVKEVIREIPSKDIIIKNINVQDGVYLEE